MKIAVFGGVGKTACEFIAQAMAAEHFVSWFIHSNDQLPDKSLESAEYHDVIRIIRGSSDILSKYQDTIRDCDAVLVAFDPINIPPSIWLHQQKLIQIAMEKEQISRILLVTSHGAGDSSRHLDWTTWAKLAINQLRHFLFGKMDVCWSLASQYGALEQIVMNPEENKLKWTILRPGILVDGPRTGTYLASRYDVHGGCISYADLADCALQAFEGDMDIGECFSVAYSQRVA